MTNVSTERFHLRKRFDRATITLHNYRSHWQGCSLGRLREKNAGHEISSPLRQRERGVPGGERMCFETTHELLSSPTIRTAGRARHGRGISGALRAATRRSAERYPGTRVRECAWPPRASWRGRGGDHAADAPRPRATLVRLSNSPSSSRMRDRRSRSSIARGEEEKCTIVTARRAALIKGRRRDYLAHERTRRDAHARSRPVAGHLALQSTTTAAASSQWSSSVHDSSGALKILSVSRARR